jgi:four helix bundle protein
MSGRVSDYRDLLVWQKGIALVKAVYVVSQLFPADERFGLTAQIRRAAVSVPSNIAEGQARHTTREFIHFLSNAEGSAAEIDTQLTIALELGFCAPLDAESVFGMIEEMRRMLNSLRRKLQDKIK